MKRSELARIGQTSRDGLSRITLTARTLALALSLAFVVGACDAYAQSAGGGASGGGSSTGDLTVGIAGPTDGSEASIPFEVTLESNVALGPPETGSHHVHLYFDTGTDSSDYDLVYGPTAQVTRELAPGEHTIIASLRNADHSDAGPSQTITIVVGEAEGGAGPVPAATPIDIGY